MKENEKKILIGGGILAVLVSGYFLINKSDNSGSADDPTGNGEIQPGDSYSNFNAAKVASELYEIMGRTIPNKTGIFNALRTVSQTQFGEVIKAFGTKKYSEPYGNTLEGFWETLPYRNLVYWLKSELGNEISTLKLKYPKYL